MNRRRFLVTGGGVLLAAGLPLTGCSRADVWPEGMQPIRWDRDTCTRCKMVISDRRFAAQLRGGPQAAHFSFDDIGCLVVWLRGQSWAKDGATRIWVADGESVQGDRWLDAPQAHYLAGKMSPMGYNHLAYAAPQGSSVDFETMRQRVLAMGR